MVQYYWNPTYQNQHITPPQVTIPSGRPPSPGVPIGPLPGPPAREQSYIENILRLNIGQPGTFHFSFEHALESGKNTKAIVGTVVAAGRDHVILDETGTGHEFLFPMIYFDYAEFDGKINYFPQQP
ncbi:spore coat protein GerQ [Sporosarcina sp. FSL K6-1522]|uniref:spore coat protein GerQ n=1 Tax=Sporosarcina sp. FSL K6-1522 TaxID=2921554 RepID=UPI003159CD10